MPRPRRILQLLVQLVAGAALWGLASAQPLATLASPATWLTPTASGVVALLDDGSVVRVGDARTLLLARRWQGDSLLACGGAVYGIDAVGRLASTAGRVGPRVSVHASSACLPDGSLVALANTADRIYQLSPALTVIAERPIDALADTEIVPIGQALALLTQPTMRYRHGVLGDEVEAAGVTVLEAGTLRERGRFTLSAPYVIEQRRVQPFSWQGNLGLYLTRSSNRAGAGVVALKLSPEGLSEQARGEEIGLGNRWLNLFAARQDRAYAVRTPHIGGPLERYRLTAAGLEVERFQLEVTNHVIGSRNLDLGVLLPDLSPGSDWLALPRRDLRAIRLIRCDLEGCLLAAEFPLESRLGSNLAWRLDDGELALYAADRLGTIYRFALDLR